MELRSKTRTKSNRKQNSPSNGHTNHSNGKPVTNGIGKPTSNGTTQVHGELINVKERGFLGRFFSHTMLPLMILAFIPNLSILMWFTCVRCEGSYLKMFQTLSSGSGFATNVMNLWIELITRLDREVWWILLGYCVFALIVMVIMPGKRVTGPLTAKGNIPVYKDNGFKCYVFTLLTFAGLTYGLYRQGLTPTIVYDRFDSFLVATNLLGHVLCLGLLVKGFTAPSSSDSGSSGNLLFDYYWGTELYPRIAWIDVKVFTNCRYGMTVWPLLCLIFALKSYELHGFVDSMWLCCALQMIYITKFFWWEAGYYQSIDIIVDRAGLMICWGCLTFIPAMYTSCSLYLVNNPVRLGPAYTALIFTAGAASIAVNYWADYQRQVVRSTNGKTTIWGRPPKLIRAKYWVTQDGDSGKHIGPPKQSLLLVSGFWGIARHFNYIPEILLAFFWSLPGLFDNLMVYSYVIYLIILLTHRSVRDDEKCRRKYGAYWEEYCQQVPYKMVPGIL